MNQHSHTPSMGVLNDRALTRIQEALESLVPAGEAFSIANWAKGLESFLYKRIHFVELPLPAGFFGARAVLLPVDGAREKRPVEIVITAAGLLPIMREHVRAHELAHIALGHQTVILSAQQFAELQQDVTAICHWPGATCRAVDPERELMPMLELDIMAETLARLAEKRHMELRLRNRASGITSDAAMDRLIKSVIGA